MQCGLAFAREDEERLVFRGTRVPVNALFETLKDGATLNLFVQWFPGVTRGHAIAVVEFVQASLAIDTEALLETAEILAIPDAMKAIADYEGGKTKFVPLCAGR